MNKDLESWAKVKAESVAKGSHAQVVNVIQMALDDIASLGAQNATLRNLLKNATENKPRGTPRMRFAKT